MIKDAKYTSVWDGDYEITTECKVDTESKEVFDIHLVDVVGVEILEMEYVTIDGIDHDIYEEDDGCVYYE